MSQTSASASRSLRNLVLFTLAAAVVSVVSPRSADAGAWAQKDKNVYLKASYAYSFANEQYKTEGTTFPLISANEEGNFRSSALLFYGEFGLFPRLTYIASTSVVSAVVDSELVRIRTTGLSDFTTGLKFQFLDKPVAASISSLMSVPTGYTAAPQNIKSPTLGTGVPAYEANLSIGKSLYPIPIYVSAQAGYRLRGSRPADGGEAVDYPPEIPYSAEVGVSAADWLLVRGVLNGVHGLGDQEELNLFSLSPLTQTYMKAGPSVIFTVAEDIQLNLDYLYTLSGVNAIKSHDVSAGVALDYAF